MIEPNEVAHVLQVLAVYFTVDIDQYQPVMASTIKIGKVNHSPDYNQPAVFNSLFVAFQGLANLEVHVFFNQGQLALTGRGTSFIC